MSRFRRITSYEPLVDSETSEQIRCRRGRLFLHRVQPIIEKVRSDSIDRLLPPAPEAVVDKRRRRWPTNRAQPVPRIPDIGECRSEEHTSELQSHHDLVCRLL